MKAILVKQPGDAGQLVLGDSPDPVPGEREILVKIKATALNRADILQRRGLYPPPPGASEILGLEFSGVVERPGPKCSRWRVGDRVFGLLAGGGYAEYATIHEQMAMPIPTNLTFEQAAAIPEAFLTAFQAFYLIADFKTDQAALIHAGASGVGTAAIQLVRQAGSRAIVTAGSPEKLQACRKLGAVAAFNYTEGPFAEHVLQATGGRGVDVILDFVGAAYLEQNIQCLAPDGCMVILSLLGGWRGEHIDLRAVLTRRLRIIGSTLRGRSLDYKIKLTQAFAKYALAKFETGALQPVIDRVFSWEEIQEAHRYMEANRNIGKIVITGM